MPQFLTALILTFKSRASVSPGKVIPKDKDYRLWYMLNKNAKISVRTSVGESDFRTITNSLGQCSFGAELASLLNI